MPFQVGDLVFVAYITPRQDDKYFDIHVPAYFTFQGPYKIVALNAWSCRVVRYNPKFKRVLTMTSKGQFAEHLIPFGPELFKIFKKFPAEFKIRDAQKEALDARNRALYNWS